MRYLLIFIIAALITLFITPFVIKLANKLGAIDIPNDERRIHKQPIPRMGGLSIYIAFIITSLTFIKIEIKTMGIILGATFIVIMGVIDDIKSLKAKTKLLVQIAAAGILILFDVRINSLSLPFVQANPIDIGYFGILLTILWIVGITNAINLIDGLDGLACGTSMITAFTLYVISILSNRYFSSVMSAVIAGSCLGFLYYNFNPAKIFLGDTGSQLLGFLLGSIAIFNSIKYHTAFSIFGVILMFGVPIYDTFTSIIRRRINGKPIMSADRGHIHHRLLDKGFTQRQTTLIMYGISVILGISSITAFVNPDIDKYIISIILIIIIAYRKIIIKIK